MMKASMGLKLRVMVGVSGGDLERDEAKTSSAEVLSVVEISKKLVRRDSHDILQRIPHRSSLIKDLPPFNPNPPHLPLLRSPLLPHLTRLHPNLPPSSSPLRHPLLVRPFITSFEPNETRRIEPVCRC